jgi:hypothetical protein
MSYKLTQKYRLVARTTPEIYYHLNELVSRLAARADVSFRGRKLGVEAALNAIALHWLSMGEDEQLRVIRDEVRRYEQLLDSSGSGPAPTLPLDAKKAAPKGGIGEEFLKEGYEINPRSQEPRKAKSARKPRGSRRSKAE